MSIKVNRTDFYNVYRTSLGKLTPEEVKGVEYLLNRFEKEDRINMKEQFGYILATVYHETAATMKPIEEYGKGKGKLYGRPEGKGRKVYYGRGYVQLTWGLNYKLMGQILNKDLYSSPYLALEPDIAYDIMIEGMKRGSFCKGHTLDKYINSATIDYVGARKIINGTDRANTIAKYAKTFEQALSSEADDSEFPSIDWGDLFGTGE